MNTNLDQSPIGVMGCLRHLPNDFPILYPENSGNMVHANAPFKIFQSAFFIKDHNYNALGYRSFSEFVNTKCSHLVITLANTLRVHDENGDKYQRLLEFVKKIEKPVVVFGLGIQAKDLDLSTATLHDAAIRLVKTLSSKATLLGVRGKSTKLVLDKLCGITNTFVTGCPSIFSDLGAIKNIRENLKTPRGRPAFSGTRYFEETENKLLRNAIQSDCWLIEPVNKFNHEYFLKVLAGETTHSDIPYFMKRFIDENSQASAAELSRFFERRYKLFRGVDEWYQFNRDSVSFSYGTRFHANMATLISGKPALWLTHDERTRELTDFMKLPNIDVETAKDLSPDDIFRLTAYDEFFDNFPKLTANFNFYLESNGLPPMSLKQ